MLKRLTYAPNRTLAVLLAPSKADHDPAGEPGTRSDTARFMTPTLAVATAVTFVWLGVVLAISVMEAPLEFRAPDVTVRIGLASFVRRSGLGWLG